MTTIRLLLLFALVSSASAADRKLEADLQALRRDFHGQMSIYMKNLKTGKVIALDADRVHETYSVIKIPIMVEVLRRAEAGEFKLSDRIELTQDSMRLGSGVLSRLDPGLQPTIRDLLTLMIIVSDNTATDILADKVGRANVTRTMASMGLKNTTLEFTVLEDYRTWFRHMDPHAKLATVEDINNFPLGKYTEDQVDEATRKLDADTSIYFGHSTAREMGLLLERIAEGKAVSKGASELMLRILRRQQVNDRFPRYLRDVSVAHKTGDSQPTIANDAGVLWVNDQPIVLVVFTAEHRELTEPLHDAIARVASCVAKAHGGKVTVKNPCRARPPGD